MKWTLVIATLLLAGGLHAETASTSDRPQAKAMEIETPPAWENIFEDARWQQATPFSLQSPSNVRFSTPPESTQVRVLWCKEYLLVRFDCHDQSIVSLGGSDAAMAKRDLPYYQADAVEVFLDPVGDGRMYMEFQLSPKKGVFDAIYLCTTTPRSGPDFMLEGDIVNRDLFFIKEWNLIGLKTAARIWPKSEGPGWSVVAAFPAKEILHRLGQKEFASGMDLRFNFVRFNYFSDGRPPVEITNWAPVLAGCAHISPAGMGTVVLAPHN
jgi:Carbohydrate family 9 binding domain-like